MSFASHVNVVLSLAASMLASGTVAAAEEAAPLIAMQSRLGDASLVAAREDGSWVFKSGEAEHTVAARNVVRYGHFVVARGQHRLRLASGGELVAYALSVAGDQVVVESDQLEALKVPLASARALVFDIPADAATARRVEERLAAAASDRDTLLFANGDELAGRFVSWQNDSIAFESDERQFAVDRSRLSAVVLKRTEATSSSGKGSQVWVGLRDGSCILARNVTVRDDRAKIGTADGLTVSAARDAVVALQPLGGDAVYLSDLDDAGYRHIPFLSLPWDYKRDRNVAGGPLTAGGKLYLKGLGMHSAARITYDLDGGYKRFQAELAIDDATGGLGSVTCRVFLDYGAGKWEAKYESPVIRGGDKPVSVDVPLAGAKRISLLVDFADRGDEQDHINWLDARLIK